MVIFVFTNIENFGWSSCNFPMAINTAYFSKEPEEDEGSLLQYLETRRYLNNY